MQQSPGQACPPHHCPERSPSSPPRSCEVLGSCTWDSAFCPDTPREPLVLLGEKDQAGALLLRAPGSEGSLISPLTATSSFRGFRLSGQWTETVSPVSWGKGTCPSGPGRMGVRALKHLPALRPRASIFQLETSVPPSGPRLEPSRRGSLLWRERLPTGPGAAAAAGVTVSAHGLLASSS